MEGQRGKHFDPVCFDAFKTQIDSVLKIQNMLPDYNLANTK
jgi:response regulator RpfG family c-di-GMP phosphodiesterase